MNITAGILMGFRGRGAPMTPKQLLRIAGLSGILGPIVGLGLVLAATTMDPNFSWSEDPLSDLGVGPAAALFNGGVILAGLLILPLALGLRTQLPKGLLATIGFVVLIIGGISLALVGIFTEDYPALHGVSALGYFVLVPFGLLVLAAAFRDPRRRYLAAGAGILALLSIFGLPLVLRGVGFGVPELVEALVLAAWLVATGWDLLAASMKTPQAAAAPA